MEFWQGTADYRPLSSRGYKDTFVPKALLRLLKNGGMLSIGLKITATSNFSGMEIAQKLGSGLKLRDVSVESKMSAKFAKKAF